LGENFWKLNGPLYIQATKPTHHGLRAVQACMQDVVRLLLLCVQKLLQNKYMDIITMQFEHDVYNWNEAQFLLNGFLIK